MEIVTRSSRWLRSAIVLLLLLGLAACSGSSAPRPEVEDRSESVDVFGDGNSRPLDLEPDQPRREQPNPAVESLLNEARWQKARGNYEAAISSTERALRIAPRSTGIYLLLAQLWQSLENHQQAIRIARKGLNLSAHDAREEAQFRDLIARSRAALGEQAGSP